MVYKLVSWVSIIVINTRVVNIKRKLKVKKTPETLECQLNNYNSKTNYRHKNIFLLIEMNKMEKRVLFIVDNNDFYFYFLLIYLSKRAPTREI